MKQRPKRVVKKIEPPRHPWFCPRCGPVSLPLHGQDEQYHCPNLECDEIVAVLSREERETRTTNPYNPKHRTLAGKDTSAHSINPPARGRHGKCGACGQVRWLLRMGEKPACMSCWRAEGTRPKTR